jgi:hypothetical protein
MARWHDARHDAPAGKNTVELAFLHRVMRGFAVGNVSRDSRHPVAQALDIELCTSLR